MKNLIFSTVLLFGLTNCSDSTMDFKKVDAERIIGSWQSVDHEATIAFDDHHNYIIKFSPEGQCINLKYRLDPAEDSNKLFIEDLACTFEFLDHDKLKLTLRNDPSFSGAEESAIYYRMQ